MNMNVPLPVATEINARFPIIVSKRRVGKGALFTRRAHAVGPLPREISTPTVLVGFVSAHSKEPAAARALLAFLSGPTAAAVYKARGMEPGR